MDPGLLHPKSSIHSKLMEEGGGVWLLGGKCFFGEVRNVIQTLTRARGFSRLKISEIIYLIVEQHSFIYLHVFFK